MNTIAWQNEQTVATRDVSLSITDPGFLFGVTVAERLRTFSGRIFRLAEHMQRLQQCLQIVGVSIDFEKLDAAIREVAEHNARLLPEGSDLGITAFVTPGRHGNPTQVVHTTPLPFSDFFRQYTYGQPLHISSVHQVPASCWPAELKCRSRMHYYLADQEVRAAHPDSRALLLDTDGMISEASTASVLLYREEEGLVSPPVGKVLQSVSADFLRGLAADRQIPCVHRDIHPDELTAADEILLTSTSPCVHPVTMLNDQPVGTGRPGPVFQQLLADWSDRVGLNIQKQAERNGQPPHSP